MDLAVHPSGSSLEQPAKEPQTRKHGENRRLRKPRRAKLRVDAVRARVQNRRESGKPVDGADQHGRAQRLLLKLACCEGRRRRRKEGRAPGVVQRGEAEEDGEGDGLGAVESVWVREREGWVSSGRRGGLPRPVCGMRALSMRRPARIEDVGVVEVRDGGTQEEADGVDCQEELAEHFDGEK